MNTVVKPGFFIAILFIGLAKLPLGESRIYHKPALAKSENINKISVMNNIPDTFISNLLQKYPQYFSSTLPNSEIQRWTGLKRKNTPLQTIPLI